MAKVTFQIPIKYHYAHIKQHDEIKSTVEIIDGENRLIKIHGASPAGTDVMVRCAFASAASFVDVKSNHYYAPNIGHHRLEVDLYSGVVAHNYFSHREGQSPTISYETKYTPQTGYRIIKSPPDFPSSWDNDKAKPLTDFGYIEESPPRFMGLLIKGTATIRSMQEGLINLKLNIFDKAGYVMQIFPEFLLQLSEATQQTLFATAVSPANAEQKEVVMKTLGDITGMENFCDADLLLLKDS